MDKRNVDVVLIRMDKIGDLVVTLPVDRHPVFAGSRVHWFVSRGLGFIAEQAAPKRAVSEFKRGFSPNEFLRMIRWLKKNKPQTVVLFHTPWWVSLAVWLAGVPERIGRKSQWHSFLFYNVGVRQSRKASDRHESDYNFDLVEWGFNRLGCRKTSALPVIKKSFLRLIAPNPFGTIAAYGLKNQEYRVVHPGMAGSALNWPTKNFKELIEALSREMPVVITGTKMDMKFLNQMIEIKDLPGVKWLVDQLKFFDLLDILSQARSVTAPSTGVLHLAASLDVPVVGIYSPKRVEHPRRWGPKGIKTAVLVPDESLAHNSNVMEEITPDQVIKTIREIETSRPNHDVLSIPTA